MVYWDDKSFISFENFYDRYYKPKKDLIDEFRAKTQLCANCFSKGLPARIYRTWASLITQIHAGYVAESVFGEGSVSMSADLDHAGADFQVEYHGIILNYQIKKESFSREVRQAKTVTKPIKGEFIDLFYEVPSEDYFLNPKKKDGTFRKPYIRFIENKELNRLPNGFVIFTTFAYLEKKKRLDK